MRVAYRGPSKLDGRPVVLSVTGEPGRRSENRKTGQMLQTWILVAGVDPVNARRQGLDESNCGGCLLRGGGCYVNLGQAPNAVHNASHGVRTVDFGALRELGRDEAVRLGAYGDPAAVPAPVWRALLAHARSWTGYTHQWRDRRHRHLRGLVMASTENQQGTREAWAAGWRTFRVRPRGAALLPGEIECPASSSKTTCERCGLCRGAAIPDAPSVSIEAHGGAVQLRSAEAVAR